MTREHPPRYQRLVDAARVFVARCEKGEILSTRSQAAFRAALKHAEEDDANDPDGQPVEK